MREVWWWKGSLRMNEHLLIRLLEEEEEEPKAGRLAQCLGLHESSPQLDALFSATVPPLERLRKYCEYSYRFQAEIKARYGHVLGCPQFSLGSEISTREDGLPRKIQEILESKRKYFESAIRDAHAAGLIDAPDAAAKSRTLFAYYEGLLTQARIQNDLEVLQEAERGTRELLGVKETESVVVESNSGVLHTN